MKEKIELKEKKYERNIEILKEFYEQVWMQEVTYVENDRALYFIFKQSNSGIFSDNVKGFILNQMYSAGVKNISLFEVIESIKNKKNNINSKELGLLTDIENNDNNNYPSFRSKYDHWDNEVNTDIATPINDSNVRNMLKKYYNNYNANNNNSTNLTDTINNFIKDYLGKENGIERIDLKTDFHEKISIYRLVDKFLWLSHKKITRHKNKDSIVGKK